MARKRKGHDIKRTCEFCHERVTAARAFSDYKKGFKIYMCPNCAKRRGIRIKHAFIRKPQRTWKSRRKRH
jgi:sulfur relay (sulfurtransferase) complex TusBCD TusD component (DsrE family)